MIDSIGGPTIGTSQPWPVNAPPAQRVQILEGRQQQRENADLFSSLPGGAQPFFPAAEILSQVGGSGPFPAPATGPGAYSATGARERLNVPLIETLQAGRETSALLSAAMQPVSRVFGPPASTPALQPLAASAAGGVPASGAPIAEMTAGEEITAALAAAPPSPTSLRVATEAYQMEIDAQRELGRQASGTTSHWEWLA